MNSYEVENDRPMVGALAVSKTTGHSGSGFAGLGRELGFPVPKDEEGRRSSGRPNWTRRLSTGPAIMRTTAGRTTSSPPS
jgi:hypothetical protein